MTPKQYRLGTHRALAPAATLERVAPRLAAWGITRLGTITGLDTIGVPVVMATRPGSRALSVSQGKGLTLAAARVSAIMEAAESYHAERIAQPLRLGSAVDLDAEGLAHVPCDAIPRLAGATWTPDTPRLWVAGLNLLDDADVAAFVPYDLVHTRYTPDGQLTPAVFDANTTGLAAGNTMAEALVHALAEAIEREVTAAGPPAMADQLDLGTVDDPGCRQVLERCERAGVAVAAWARPNAYGMAVYQALVMDRDADNWRGLHGAQGAGAHPTRGIALCRALAEAVQARVTVIAGTREDLGWDEFARIREPATRARLHAIATTPGSAAYGALPTVEHETLEEDARWLCARLAGAGVAQAVGVVLHVDPAVAVVRVVVPGFRHGLVGAEQAA